MKAVWILTVINALLVAGLASEYWVMGAVVGFFWLLSISGALLFQRTGKRAFAYLSIAGFALFIPLGLIGIFAIKKMMNADREPPVQPGELPRKTYIYSTFAARAFLVTGCLMIVLDVLIRVLWQINSMGSGISLVLVILFFVVRKMEVLSVYEDRFIIKAAPLQTPVAIPFPDLKKVDRNGNRLVLTIKDRNKPLKLHLSIFNKSEREEAAALLSEAPA